MIGGINDLTIVDNGNVELSSEEKGQYIYDKCHSYEYVSFL